MKKRMFIMALAVSMAACTATKTENKTDDSTTTAAQQGQAAVAVDLFDKEWKLKELNGRAIVLDTAFKKEPHLQFNKATGKLTGNGGCNGFSGSYKVKDGNYIELSEGGATMMACPNLEIESKFFEVLKQVKSFRIVNHSLLLDNEKKETVAKLELSE